MPQSLLSSGQVSILNQHPPVLQGKVIISELQQLENEHIHFFSFWLCLLFLQTDGERDQFPNIPPLPTRNLQSLSETRAAKVGLSCNTGIYYTRNNEGSSPVAVYRADSEQLLQSHSQFPGSQDEEQELGNRGLNSHISEILPPQLKRQDPKKTNKQNYKGSCFDSHLCDLRSKV